jgi:hypothetical protein
MMTAMENSSDKIKLEEIFMKYKSLVSFYATKSSEAFNPNCDEVANEIITNVVEKKGESTLTDSLAIHIKTNYQ